MDWWGPARQSFFWYDIIKDLKRLGFAVHGPCHSKKLAHKIVCFGLCFRLLTLYQLRQNSLITEILNWNSAACSWNPINVFTLWIIRNALQRGDYQKLYCADFYVMSFRDLMPQTPCHCPLIIVIVILKNFFALISSILGYLIYRSSYIRP